MENVLFLQSEVKDPFEIYKRMRTDHPLYFDERNKLWAVYRYEDCVSVLKNSTARIPHPNPFNGESDEVKMIIQNLVRLSNPPHHEVARNASLNLMAKWKNVNSSDLIHYLIGEPRKPAVIDWVNEIGKKLPALTLLKGFNFPDSQSDQIVNEMENLVKLMLPARTKEQVTVVNESVATIFNSMRTAVSRLSGIQRETEMGLYIANLIGLLIQSFDVGRGLLCNALLQLVKEDPYRKDFTFFQRSIKEVVRWDSPVHNTRRVLKEAMTIQSQTLVAGSGILVVLASANRDPNHFVNADRYDLFRNENPQYLSFGQGAHQCIAENFSQHLAASALHYFYNKYEKIKLIETEIQFEPKINVRLPLAMHLKVS